MHGWMTPARQTRHECNPSSFSVCPVLGERKRKKQKIHVRVSSRGFPGLLLKDWADCGWRHAAVGDRGVS